MTQRSKYVISKEELSNRVKNGGLAAGGAFAISALTSYRVSQELMHDPKSGDVVKVSLIFALVAGIVWAFMPQASKSPEEHLEEVKAAITEPLNVLIVRLTQNQKELVDTAKDMERKYSSPSSTGWVQATQSFEGKSKSYMKGWNNSGNRGSIFSNDDDVMPPDDDTLTEEELSDFYRDLDGKYDV